MCQQANQSTKTTLSEVSLVHATVSHKKFFPATSRFQSLVGAQPYVFEPHRLIPNI